MKLRVFIITIFGFLAFALAVNQISNSFKKSIIEIEKNKLILVSQALSSHIETYFEGLKDAMYTSVDGPEALDALVAFDHALNNLEKSPKKFLRNNYIKNNPFATEERYELINIKGNKSLYNTTHIKYQKHFLRLRKIHDFRDIFLINKDGNIIYSVDKEYDFGTNLISGPYANSGLARVYQKAIKLDPLKIVFEDFKPYAPSNNEPSAFLATPIYQNDIFIGVFAVQISSSKINKIMTFKGKRETSGLGESGEAYMVGQDLLMRSNSRFITETSVGIIKADTSSVHKALNGESGFMQIKDYRGINAYSAYTLVNVFKQRWALIAKIDAVEILEKVQDSIIQDLIEGLLIVVILVFFFARLFYSRLVIPLEFKNRELQDDIKIKEREILRNRSISKEYKKAFDLVLIVTKTSTKGVITYANDNFCKLTGYSKDELIGQSHHMLSHPDTPKELYKNLWETVSVKRIWRGQMTNINKHKKAYTVDLTIIPILDKNGDIKEFMSIAHKP